MWNLHKRLSLYKSPFFVPVDGSKIHFYFHLSTLFVLPSLSMAIILRFLFINVCFLIVTWLYHVTRTPPAHAATETHLNNPGWCVQARINLCRER